MGQIKDKDGKIIGEMNAQGNLSLINKQSNSRRLYFKNF